MLCGYPPFKGKNEQAIKRQILKGDLNFNGKEWNCVSFEAVDLIRKLLTFDFEQRISCQQAMDSPWMQNYNKETLSDTLLDASVIKNLTVFTVKYKKIKMNKVFRCFS